MKQILTTLLLLISCSSFNDLNESPSGRFTAFLTILEGEQQFNIWVVNIRSRDRENELTVPMQDYPANLMAYMGWEDEEDRLWFYSSDDGSYYYWEQSGEEWCMRAWSIHESSLLYPPASLEDQIEHSRRN